MQYYFLGVIFLFSFHLRIDPTQVLSAPWCELVQPGSTGPPESAGPAGLSSEQVLPEWTAGLSQRGHTRRGGLLGLEGDRWVLGSRG